MEIRLEKIDPASNCFRFYVIRSEPDLFAGAALVVQWGRIGRTGRTAIRGSGPPDQMALMTQRLVRLRLHRGYVQVPVTPTGAAP